MPARPSPWALALAGLAVAALTAATARARASLVEDPLRLADGQIVSPQPWHDRARLLAPDRRDCEQLGAARSAAEHLAGLARHGRSRGVRPLQTDQGTWWSVGYLRDLPVVYRPCEGTFVILPSSLPQQGAK